MEIRVTDIRARPSNWDAREVIDKGKSICFGNNKIYFDTGYCLILPFKIIIESSSIAKLSEKYYTKNLLKGIIKCVDERNKETVISGTVIQLETRFKDSSFSAWISLSSGYLIYMKYSETDLRDIIEVVNNNNQK